VSNKLPAIYKFTQIYQMPGEGFIAEFRHLDNTKLFDLEGLRYRLLERRNSGDDTREEEKALAVLSNLDRS
jgi:hypothetical protein